MTINAIRLLFGIPSPAKRFHNVENKLVYFGGSWRVREFPFLVINAYSFV